MVSRPSLPITDPFLSFVPNATFCNGQVEIDVPSKKLFTVAGLKYTDGTSEPRIPFSTFNPITGVQHIKIGLRDGKTLQSLDLHGLVTIRQDTTSPEEKREWGNAHQSYFETVTVPLVPCVTFAPPSAPLAPPPLPSAPRSPLPLAPPLFPLFPPLPFNNTGPDPSCNYPIWGCVQFRLSPGEGSSTERRLLSNTDQITTIGDTKYLAPAAAFTVLAKLLEPVFESDLAEMYFPNAHVAQKLSKLLGALAGLSDDLLYGVINDNVRNDGVSYIATGASLAIDMFECLFHMFAARSCCQKKQIFNDLQRRFDSSSFASKLLFKALKSFIVEDGIPIGIQAGAFAATGGLKDAFNKDLLGLWFFRQFSLAFLSLLLLIPIEKQISRKTAQQLAAKYAESSQLSRVKPPINDDDLFTILNRYKDLFQKLNDKITTPALLTIEDFGSLVDKELKINHPEEYGDIETRELFTTRQYIKVTRDKISLDEEVFNTLCISDGTHSFEEEIGIGEGCLPIFDSYQHNKRRYNTLIHQINQLDPKHLAMIANDPKIAQNQTNLSVNETLQLKLIGNWNSSYIEDDIQLLTQVWKKALKEKYDPNCIEQLNLALQQGLISQNEQTSDLNDFFKEKGNSAGIQNLTFDHKTFAVKDEGFIPDHELVETETTLLAEFVTKKISKALITRLSTAIITFNNEGSAEKRLRLFKINSLKLEDSLILPLERRKTFCQFYSENSKNTTITTKTQAEYEAKLLNLFQDSSNPRDTQRKLFNVCTGLEGILKTLQVNPSRNAPVLSQGRPRQRPESRPPHPATQNPLPTGSVPLHERPLHPFDVPQAAPSPAEANNLKPHRPAPRLPGSAPREWLNGEHSVTEPNPLSSLQIRTIRQPPRLPGAIPHSPEPPTPGTPDDVAQIGDSSIASHENVNPPSPKPPTPETPADIAQIGDSNTASRENGMHPSTPLPGADRHSPHPPTSGTFEPETPDDVAQIEDSSIASRDNAHMPRSTSEISLQIAPANSVDVNAPIQKLLNNDVQEEASKIAQEKLANEVARHAKEAQAAAEETRRAKAITPEATPPRSPLHPSPSNRQASASPKTNPAFISAPLTDEQRRSIHEICSMVKKIPSFYLKIFQYDFKKESETITITQRNEKETIEIQKIDTTSQLETYLKTITHAATAELHLQLLQLQQLKTLNELINKINLQLIELHNERLTNKDLTPILDRIQNNTSPHIAPKKQSNLTKEMTSTPKINLITHLSADASVEADKIILQELAEKLNKYQEAQRLLKNKIIQLIDNINSLLPTDNDDEEYVNITQILKTDASFCFDNRNLNLNKSLLISPDINKLDQLEEVKRKIKELQHRKIRSKAQAILESVQPVGVKALRRSRSTAYVPTENPVESSTSITYGPYVPVEPVGSACQLARAQSASAIPLQRDFAKDDFKKIFLFLNEDSTTRLLNIEDIKKITNNTANYPDIFQRKKQLLCALNNLMETYDSTPTVDDTWRPHIQQLIKDICLRYFMTFQRVQDHNNFMLCEPSETGIEIVPEIEALSTLLGNLSPFKMTLSPSMSGFLQDIQTVFTSNEDLISARKDPANNMRTLQHDFKQNLVLTSTKLIALSKKIELLEKQKERKEQELNKIFNGIRNTHTSINNNIARLKTITLAVQIGKEKRQIADTLKQEITLNNKYISELASYLKNHYLLNTFYEWLDELNKQKMLLLGAYPCNSAREHFDCVRAHTSGDFKTFEYAKQKAQEAEIAPLYLKPSPYRGGGAGKMKMARSLSQASLPTRDPKTLHASSSMETLSQLSCRPDADKIARKQLTKEPMGMDDFTDYTDDQSKRGRINRLHAGCSSQMTPTEIETGKPVRACCSGKLGTEHVRHCRDAEETGADPLAALFTASKHPPHPRSRAGSSPSSPRRNQHSSPRGSHPPQIELVSTTHGATAYGTQSSPSSYPSSPRFVHQKRQTPLSTGQRQARQAWGDTVGQLFWDYV